MRRGLLVLVAGIVAACVALPGGASSATYRDTWVSFRYPEPWHVHHWSIPSPTVHYLAWVSNARLHDPCIRGLGSYRCTRPLEHLPPRGVLVTWLLVALPATGKARSGIWIDRSASCDIGADESIVRRFRSYEAEACLRGPGLSTTERKVLAMLRSARFATS